MAYAQLVQSVDKTGKNGGRVRARESKVHQDCSVQDEPGNTTYKASCL